MILLIVCLLLICHVHKLVILVIVYLFLVSCVCGDPNTQDPTGISPAGDGMLSLHEFKLAVKTWMDGGWEGVGADASGTKSQKMDIGDQDSHSYTEALNPKPVTYLEMLKKNIAADAEQHLAHHEGSVNGSQAVAETEQEGMNV